MRKMPLVRKPGAGWAFAGCATWKHSSGVRVHYFGLALMPDGTVRREHETRLAEGYIRLAGGNRKRGLMMWALALYQIQMRSRMLSSLFAIESGKVLAEPGVKQINTNT